MWNFGPLTVVVFLLIKVGVLFLLESVKARMLISLSFYSNKKRFD